MIRPISFADVFEAPNAAELFAEYAAECSIPLIGKVNPQMELYRRLEQAGVSCCFGVFEDETLVGFASMLLTVLPHYGKKIGTVESMFIAKGNRTGSAGRSLIRALEEHAKSVGCVAILYSAPAGGRLERLLPLLGCKQTNSVWARSL